MAVEGDTRFSQQVELAQWQDQRVHHQYRREFLPPQASSMEHCSRLRLLEVIERSALQRAAPAGILSKELAAAGDKPCRIIQTSRRCTAALSQINVSVS